MINLYKLSAALLLAASAATSYAADGTLTIKVSNPSEIEVSIKKGYSSEPEIIAPQGDRYVVEFEHYWDIFITPREGYKVANITGVTASGDKIDKPNAGWTFNSDDFSYSIYSSSYSNNLSGYSYDVVTEAYVAPQWTVSVDINNPAALSGGVFKAGKETVAATTGVNSLVINPDQGKTFEANMTYSVKEATLTFNGNVVEPDITYDGRFTYKFDLEENSVIKIDAVMETPVCYIVCPDPAHVKAFYPDGETPLTLSEGRTELTYTVGSTLRLMPDAGYRLKCSDNLTYDSYTKTYSVYFTGGQGGQEYAVEAEVYTEPTANITVNLADAGIVSYIGFTPGYNPHRSFEVGDNVYSYNTEDVNMMEIDYSATSEDEVIAACNGKVLEIGHDRYGALCSEISLEAGNYWIAVRKRLSGDYNGAVTFTGNEEHTLFTLEFNPGGVIEQASDALTASLLSGGTAIADLPMTFDKGMAYITVDTEPLSKGEYTVSVPAGMLKVNGAVLGAQTAVFTYDKNDAISEIETAPTASKAIYGIDGRIISDKATPEAIESLRPGLYIIGGKKVIIR